MKGAKDTTAGPSLNPVNPINHDRTRFSLTSRFCPWLHSLVKFFRKIPATIQRRLGTSMQWKESVIYGLSDPEDKWVANQGPWKTPLHCKAFGHALNAKFGTLPRVAVDKQC